MKRRAIVTAVIGEKCAPVAALTIPTLGVYAGSLAADLVILKTTPEALGETTAHWAKFHVAELLGIYDEVCWIDSDIAINPAAPSVFEAAGGQVAAYFEGAVVERAEQFKEYFRALRGREVQDMQSAWYFNSGVLVVPRAAREMFAVPPKRDVDLTVKMKREQPDRFFYDQNFLNARALETGTFVKSLDERFNLMNVPAAGRWESRAKYGWFVHYAGLLNCMGEQVLAMIREDLKAWGCFT